MDFTINIIIHNLIIIFGEVFGGLTIFIFTLRFINHNSKQLLVNQGGTYSQLICGGLGIMIHEASHLIMAIIFVHHIESFKLLKIPHPPTDMQLGYVNHSFHPRNTYQVVGNLFIGIAPVIGCSAIIFMLTQWLTPELFKMLQGVLFYHAQIKMPPLNWWHFVIWILLITNISIGGFDLSRQDLKNSQYGLFSTIIILTIIIIFITISGGGIWLLNLVSRFIHALSFVFILSLIPSLGANLIIRLLIRD